jgi:DeoR family transcriptional regulator, suf operon transcriptional repressor
MFDKRPLALSVSLYIQALPWPSQIVRAFGRHVWSNASGEYSNDTSRNRGAKRPRMPVHQGIGVGTFVPDQAVANALNEDRKTGESPARLCYPWAGGNHSMSRNVARRKQPGSTRSKVLEALKKSDGLTADQLAEIVGVTSMAVRKHLAALERDGYVETTISRRAVGRPAHLYRVSPRAEGVFPKHYDAVISDLLEDLVEIDGVEKVEALLARRGERTKRVLRRYIDPRSPLAERVAALTRAMDEIGYLASWESLDDHRYIIKLYNCAIDLVAEQFPAVCRHEASMFRDVLDADVERGCHMLTGDHMCSYLVQERDPSAAPRIPLTAAHTPGSV